MTEDELSQLSEDEISRLWELYVEECRQRSLRPSLRDFPVWLQER